jgi:hypothetical protein
MRIPNKIHFLGQDYTVEFVPTLSHDADNKAHGGR